MLVQRLMEAAMRLAGKDQPTFISISIDVHERHEMTVKDGYALKTRRASINIFRPSVGTTKPNGHILVGTADIDLNGMIMAIRFEEDAPYWAVKPFTDALEGK